MSETKKKTKKTSEEVVNEVTEPVEVPEVPEPVAEVVTRKGIVVDCFRLNVRKKPKSNAAVLAEINKSAEVTVHEEGSTDDFYKVTTKSGVEGFCMKKYIKIKP